MYTDLNMGAYLVYNTSTCMISSALCLKEREKKKARQKERSGVEKGETQ